MQQPVFPHSSLPPPTPHDHTCHHVFVHDQCVLRETFKTGDAAADAAASQRIARAVNNILSLGTYGLPWMPLPGQLQARSQIVLLPPAEFIAFWRHRLQAQYAIGVVERKRSLQSVPQIPVSQTPASWKPAPQKKAFQEPVPRKSALPKPAPSKPKQNSKRWFKLQVEAAPHQAILAQFRPPYNYKGTNAGRIGDE